MKASSELFDFTGGIFYRDIKVVEIQVTKIYKES